jgi:hypothetical protein
MILTNGCLAITVADAGHVPDLDVVVQGMQKSWAALKQKLAAAPIAVLPNGRVAQPP